MIPGSALEVIRPHYAAGQRVREAPRHRRANRDAPGFFVLNQPEELAHELAESLVEVKEKVGLCERCCNLTDEALCSICKIDPARPLYDLRGWVDPGSAERSKIPVNSRGLSRAPRRDQPPGGHWAGRYSRA